MGNQLVDQAQREDGTAVEAEAEAATPAVSNSDQAAAAARARGGADGGAAAAHWVHTMAGTATGLPPGAAPPAPTHRDGGALAIELGGAGGFHLTGGGQGAPDLRLPEQTPLTQRMERFRAAITARDKQAAETEWMLASDAERKAWGQSPSVELELGWVLDTLGIETMMVMGQAGLKFTDRPSFAARVYKVMHAYWLDSMAVHDLVDDFVATLPPRWEIDARQQAILDKLMKGTNSVEAAKALFERMYTKLSDTTYDATTLHTRPWTRPWIDRLYHAVTTYLPLTQVRAVDAFYIGYEYKEDASDAAFEKLTNGWWSDGHVVLNEGSAETGGGRDHDMTGGTDAQLDPVSGAGKKKGKMNHFDVGALHEVGHAVGARMGGNEWAYGYDFVGWQINLTVEDWSAQLWGDDHFLNAAARMQFPVDDLPTSAEVRRYIAHTFDGNGIEIPGWDSIRMMALIDTCYGDQPLTRYWKLHGMGKGAEDAYTFGGTNNYGNDGEYAYVYLSRGRSNFSRYKTAAHEQKVSWYSLAAPREWFAEQYAHYHRLSPMGTGMEPGTKAKMDEIHAAEYADPDAPMPFPASTGGGAAQAAASGATVSATLPDSAPRYPTPRKRLPFAW